MRMKAMGWGMRCGECDMESGGTNKSGYLK